MSLVDSLEEVLEQRKSKSITFDEQEDALGWTLNSTDISHMLRATSIILRRGALLSDERLLPYNVYLKEKALLPLDILDSNSSEIGKFLVEKFCCKNALFGCEANDLPNVENVVADKGLIARAKRSKGVTIRRGTTSKNPSQRKEQQIMEVQRKQKVRKEVRKVEGLSSAMNTCQALVKPDCTKRKVQKSTSMQKALANLLLKAVPTGEIPNLDALISVNLTSVPTQITTNVKYATVEFAGVKLKVHVASGTQYVRAVEGSVIKPILFQFPNLKRLVICEEKYSFTPDSFKAATREQRTSKSSRQSISYLKISSGMLSSDRIDKRALIETREGKLFISQYLAENVTKLSLKTNVTPEIDSELHLHGCVCQDNTHNQCALYTSPITCKFHDEMVSVQPRDDIKQCKGEAEMAQVDWLMDFQPHLEDHDAVHSEHSYIWRYRCCRNPFVCYFKIVAKK